MITETKNIIIEGKHQKPILTDVFYNKNIKQKAVVIFCHGYKGFKDWGAWDVVAETFAKAGFFFIKFNFSHNGGTIKQPIDFLDLQAFGNNNYVKELDDLQTIIDWVTSSDFDFIDQVDMSKITVVGHSRGGGIAAIKASEEPKVSKLVTWASVSDFYSRFPKGEALDSWKKNGVMYIENGRTKQQMPHYYQFYTSFNEHKERLTIANAIQKITKPHLIIHGTDDTSVDLKEAKKIHAWNPNSELFILDNVNHIFGTKHPWNEKYLSQDLNAVVKKTMSFIINNKIKN